MKLTAKRFFRKLSVAFLLQDSCMTLFVLLLAALFFINNPQRQTFFSKYETTSQENSFDEVCVISKHFYLFSIFAKDIFRKTHFWDYV